MGITNTGMAQTAKLLGTDVTDSATFDCIAIGTDATNFVATQTTLLGYLQEAVGATVVGTLTMTTVANDTLTLTKDSFSFGGAYSINEVGAFIASHTGIMLCRTKLTATISVTATDTLKVVINIQVKQGA
jgi:hypothetical protein